MLGSANVSIDPQGDPRIHSSLNGTGDGQIEAKFGIHLYF